MESRGPQLQSRGTTHPSTLAAHPNQSINTKDQQTYTDQPNHLVPPSAHFIKINFDGASKGNPGTTGYGAVIRDSKGEILGLIAGFLGETTNNVAELTGLLRGLQAAMDKGYHKLS
jgi:hypothetical protein